MKSNVIKTYDDMLYDSRPTSFNEFINDKYNNVHNELYNNALSKYFDNIIDVAINSSFICEFYKNMQNNSDTFDDLYNIIKNLNNESYIKKSLNSLSINEKDFLQIMYELTCESLDKLKEYIKNKDIINGILQISDIKDFRILYVNDATYIGPENEDDEGFNTDFFYYDIEGIDNEQTIKVYESELEDYIFILEEEDGTRIGYNMKGEWLLILGQGYSYKTKEEKENINILKKELINHINNTSKNLINLYKIAALNEYKKHHKIIEIKNSEYWMPSSIIIISNVRPYKKETIKLDKYWNMIQSANDVNVYDVKNCIDNVYDAELYELNYISGVAKVRSRNADIEYEVPFKYLDGNINVSDEMTLNKTFKSMYNKL